MSIGAISDSNVTYSDTVTLMAQSKEIHVERESEPNPFSRAYSGKLDDHPLEPLLIEAR